MEESKKNAEQVAMEFSNFRDEMKHEPRSMRLASQYIEHQKEGRIGFSH